MVVAPTALARERGLLSEDSFREMSAKERALRAIRPLLSLGERSIEEARFDRMRADEQEMAVAIKAGDLLPYMEFRSAQSAEMNARTKELLTLDFGKWRHAVMFEDLVRRNLLNSVKQERSLQQFRVKARELLVKHEKMRSILASTGAYYGNRSAKNFWGALNTWCRQHLEYRGVI